MKLKYDRAKIKESINAGAYNERNLSVSKSGKHQYPSKLMFIRFLEQFEDVRGTADIWSIEHGEDGTVEIHVEVKYKVPNLRAEKREGS